MRQYRHDLGTISGGGSATAVRLERHLAATPAEVWQLLTDPAELTGWLCAAVEIEPRPGGTISLRFANTDTAIHGRVLRFDAPSVLEYTWRTADEPESIVRFELRPTDSATGTRLLLTHTRCDHGQAGSFAAGWHQHLDLLTSQLAGQTPAWEWSRYNTLLERYRRPVA